ncbi:glycosyltransferase family 9 protein [Flavobacterium sp. RNTU_13]|uniref:glycosyltransferase family 9 protein n=1 Tax=Flavobacterium sp. RNTU_13 TaxID=3375145 RepID=UPI0039873FB1
MPHKKGKGHIHLLVLRFSAMGDVAMTVPVLHALTTQHPEVRVIVASRAAFKPFFDGLPNVSFHAADLSGSHKGFFGILRLYKELKALHIYAVADLHNVLRTKIITKLFAWRGKKTATLNKMRDAQKRLTAAVNKDFSAVTPIVYRHADVFKALGFPVVLNESAVLPKPALPNELKDMAGPNGIIRIGIAPFAQHMGKVYPTDLMRQVIDALAAKPGIRLYLFGGNKHEAHQLKKMAAERLNIEVVAGGRFTLKQELQLIANLNVMLSMDSANGHMAAMYSVPVITLWGATHPYAGFVPYNQPLSNSITSDREKYPLLPTSVYGNKVVPGYEDAMRTITPQMVLDKIGEVLSRKS